MKSWKYFFPINVTVWFPDFFSLIICLLFVLGTASSKTRMWPWWPLGRVFVAWRTQRIAWCLWIYWTRQSCPCLLVWLMALWCGQRVRASLCFRNNYYCNNPPLSYISIYTIDSFTLYFFRFSFYVILILPFWTFSFYLWLLSDVLYVSQGEISF